MAVKSPTETLLDRIRMVVSPDVFNQISATLKDAALDDNQNQNQGLTEELANLKPNVLKEILFGAHSGEEQMDNQNQNQGKLAELLKLKPDVLRQLRVTLRGDEVMDNQNQNQGSTADNTKPQL